MTSLPQAEIGSDLCDELFTGRFAAFSTALEHLEVSASPLFEADATHITNWRSVAPLDGSRRIPENIFVKAANLFAVRVAGDMFGAATETHAYQVLDAVANTLKVHVADSAFFAFQFNPADTVLTFGRAPVSDLKGVELVKVLPLAGLVRDDTGKPRLIERTGVLRAIALEDEIAGLLRDAWVLRSAF